MTDKQLHDEILAELEFEPQVRPERIGVSVEHGVVTLSGHVDSYAQKLAAERVVKRVYSVKALVNHLEVKLPSRDEVPDEELAENALRMLRAHAIVPQDVIRVSVQDGWVSLEGQVDWYCEALAAEEAVRSLRGVRGIFNHVRVRPHPQATDVKASIREALRRYSGRDVERIQVTVEQGRVVLSGSVPALREKDELVLAAWRVPGVEQVDDRVTVVPSYR